MPIDHISQPDVRAADIVGVSSADYGVHHGPHLLEQYKMYVQLADKISDRRHIANAFFISINTALVTILGTLKLKESTWIGPAWHAIVAMAGGVLCWTWYQTLRSYQNLNRGKFAVIHEIEQRLPIRPYDAEWATLGHGKLPEVYKPFTRVEQIVPGVFACLYFALVGISVVNAATQTDDASRGAQAGIVEGKKESHAESPNIHPVH